ncbi:MAG TPA: hypothetical protein VNJ01_09355 [Bacteriovoracaceae bacterium]|nr:hypothetical protein [Bacteriovoracaceae bacterium]
MKCILSFIFTLVSASALAEKSFVRTNPRDNAICYVNGKRLEIFIRGASDTTEPAENGTGEALFYKVGETPPDPLQAPGFDSYKFFAFKDSACSKTAGFLLEKDLFVVLLLKENTPHKEKLSIQPFELPGFKPQKMIETAYLIEQAYQKHNAVYFLTEVDNENSHLGKVKIKDLVYTYQDRDFPIWMSYSRSGFEILPGLSYTNLPWKRFFKNEREFLDISGWDPELKKFKNSVVYLGNHPAKNRKCILLVPKKIKITGKEKWRCQ